MEAKDVRQEALEAYGTSSAAVTGRDHLTNAVIALTVVAVLLVVTGWALWMQVDDVREFQREGRDRTYESRAVACSNLAQDGQDLPPPCLMPEVTAHYDPTP